MSKKDQLLHIDPPNELIFTGPFDDLIKSYIRLTNPTESKMAFKIKTTTPKQYCVRPNFGLIEPNETVTVSITLVPFSYNPNEKYRHKFMVQSVILTDETFGNIAWEKFAPEELMDSKLLCVFQMPENGNKTCNSEVKINDAVHSTTIDQEGAGEPISSQKIGNKLTSSEVNQNDLQMDSINSDVVLSRMRENLDCAMSEIKLLRNELKSSETERHQLKEELKIMRANHLESNQLLKRNLAYSDSSLSQLHLILIAITIAIIGVILGKFAF